MRKRIYNKKDFAWGLICLVLAAVCGVTMALRGFSFKLLGSMVVALAMGWADLMWSMDKSMRMPRPDERDQQVVQISAWRAYQLLTNGCLLAALALMIAYGVWRSPLLTAAFLTLDIVVLAAFLLLLGTNLYYEKRM